MGLAIVGEDVLHAGIHFLAVLSASLLHDLDATEGLDGAAEEFVGLQTNDEFVLLVDVASLVRGDGRYGIGVEGTYTAVSALFFESLEAEVPYLSSALRRANEERGIAFVGGQVAANEVSHIDARGPRAVDELCFQIHGFVGLKRLSYNILFFSFTWAKIQISI